MSETIQQKWQEGGFEAEVETLAAVSQLLAELFRFKPNADLMVRISALEEAVQEDADDPIGGNARCKEGLG